MNRIKQVFAGRRNKALVAYLTVGYPDIQTTLEAVPSLVEAGCDIVELGIPFSDPLADGVTIQRASYEALKKGVTSRTCLEVAAKLRKQVDIPLLFMSYYNPILRYGVADFCKACVGAGVDGLIVPDLPPEEGGSLDGATISCGLACVYLLSPASTDERIRLVASHSRGFIYLVSLRGVTGARNALPRDLDAFVGRVRAQASQPLCVGFGISTPVQARQVADMADGIIIGSRLVELVSKDGVRAAASFVRTVRQALDDM